MHQLFLITLILISGLICANEQPGNNRDSNQWALAQQILPEGFPGGPGKPLTSGKHVSQGPASFQPNLGQAPSNIDFVAKSTGYRMYVTGTGLVFNLLVAEEGQPGVKPGTVTLNLVGANMLVGGQGEAKQPKVSNYLYGSKQENWVYDVPSYSKVRYSNIYPGIDLVFYGNGDRAMEHDFVVSPTANYRDIKLAIDGAQTLQLSQQGDINIEATGGGKLRLKKPWVYQTTGAGTKIEIPSHYELTGENQVSFWIDETQHDRTLDLVIDPVTLTYSSYLGGSSDDVVVGMAVDSSGNMFVSGYTVSTNFPTASPYQSSNNGGDFDAFVTKIASGGAISISTYLGGSGDEVAMSVKFDSAGNIYLAGYSTSPGSGSTNFPTTGTPGTNMSLTNHGGYDAFLAKLSSSLTFTGSNTPYFSVYYGGTGFDSGSQIALDTTATGCTTSGFPCIMMIGTTSTSGIPTSGFASAYLGGICDAFVARFATTTLSQGAFTYMGSTGRDIGIAIAVDTSGNPPYTYVAGQTDTNNFGLGFASSGGSGPGIISSFQGGGQDGFIAKLNPNLGVGASAYSSFVGGSGYDSVSGIAVYPTTGTGSAYVIGTTTAASGAFSATNGNGFNGGKDIFIAKDPLTQYGTNYTYMTFIGGSGNDTAPGLQSIAVDSAGLAWFVGRTQSSGLTTVGAVNGSGYSTYPTSATTSGLYGYISSATSASTYNVYSYLGNTSGTDLLSSVVVTGTSPNTTAYLGGYASETGLPIIGSTFEGYTGAKDVITSVSSYTSTGCPSSVTACVSGTSVYTNLNYFNILQLSAVGGAASNVSTSDYDYGSVATIPNTGITNYVPFSTGATVIGTSLTAGEYALLVQMANPTNAEGPLGSFPTTAPTSMKTSSYVSAGSTGTTTVTGYSGYINMNGVALSCCTVGSQIEIISASGTTNGGSSGGSLTYALAKLDSTYTLIGGGAYVTGNTNTGGNLIFASYPAKYTGSEAFTLSTYGLKVSNNNCLYSGLSAIGTGSGSTGPTPLSTAGCNAWAAASRDNALADAATMVAYAVGIQSSLLPLANVYVSASITAAAGVAANASTTESCTMGSPYVLISGGSHSIWSTMQQFLQQNYLSGTGSSAQWNSSAISIGSDSTTQLISYCIGISP